MSNPFTYEIDERNLRIQLRSAEIPLKEEAWKKFESYYEAHATQETKTKFKGFELSVNRNIVLPVVFGLIIVVFSFLLFNFISVNNPRVEKKTEPVQVSVPEVEVNNMAVANAQPDKTSESPVQNNSTGNSKSSALPVNVEQADQNKPTAAEINVESTTTESNSITPSVVTSEVAPERPEAAIDSSKEVTVQKQKRRKKREEETLSAIKPTIVTDEEDAAVIPNLSE